MGCFAGIFESVMHVLTQEAEPPYPFLACCGVRPSGCWPQEALLWTTLCPTKRNPSVPNQRVNNKIPLLRKKQVATLARLLEPVELSLNDEPCQSWECNND